MHSWVRCSDSSSSDSESTIVSVRIRFVVALGIPLCLLVAGSIVDDPGVSTGLLCAAVISLLVWVAESVIEAKPLELPRAELPPDETAIDTKRVIELFTFVGDTTRMLVELSSAGEPVLDGWLSLVSGRVARVTGSAAAGFMVLRETLILEGEDFLPGCEVVHRGGSKRCTLPVGGMVQMHDAIENDLLLEIGAGTAYVAEFNVNQDRYLLCLAQSSRRRQPLLSTLCKIMVAPVVASLDPTERHGGARVTPSSLSRRKRQWAE